MKPKTQPKPKKNETSKRGFKAEHLFKNIIIYNKLTMEKRMRLYTDMLTKANLTFNQHQYEGIEFCLNNELELHMGIYGGIIADEMGLGKTLTAIGTMVANPVFNTLIVVPPVLLVQWQKEFFRATGQQALLYHGQQKKHIKIRELLATPIVITTYNAIRSTNKHQNLLHDVAWDRVIFDEAHHLRNKNLAHKGALALKTKIRWLITGTPIQNDVCDFHNLCAVMGLSKGIYSDKTFASKIMNTFVLKRVKRMIREISTKLPDFITHSIQVEWNKEGDEYRLAKEVHSTLPMTNIIGHMNGPYAKKIQSAKILMRMLRAKQCCVLPSLLAPDLKKFKVKYSTSDSSKLDAVIQAVVDNEANGAGKLIFCHYRKEIDEIANRLNEIGIRNSTFDGRTSNSDRLAILSDPNNLVIILQIQTGCEGLNLQQYYSEVYFVSPHWNPSVEEQAIGRCHRMGQTKQVHVYRFKMAGFDQEEKEVVAATKNEKEEEEEEEEEEEDKKKKMTISLDGYIRTVQKNKRKITFRIMSGDKEE